MVKVKTKSEIQKEYLKYVEAVSVESKDLQISLLKAKLHSTMLEKNSLEIKIADLIKDPKNKFGKLMKELNREGALTLYNLRKLAK